MRSRRLAGLALGAAIFAAALVGRATARAGAAEDELRARGRTLYATYCARCHGDDGADTTTYPGAKSLLDITQRLSREEVIEKSRGFAAVALEGEEAAALYAYLQTFRSGGYARPELLVETSWVALHRNDPRVRLVDLRSEAAYAAGHIPGAVRLDEGPLRDPNATDYLPDPEALARLMSRAGIGNDTHVVAYDDQGGRSAARLWLVLNAYGHERVSLLNGGWLKWTAERRPVETQPARPQPATFVPRRTPNLVCAAPEVLARRPGVVLLDARTEAEYAGRERSSGAARAGRIPGAVNVEWKEAVTGPHLVFKSGPELRKLFAGRGITPDREIIAY